jgi:acyl-coenzyme A synthetase/AMP-(fatty) acid ligase
MKYRIKLNLEKVPPIIIQMTKNRGACSKSDLSRVRAIFTGAAPLGAELAKELQGIYPSWKIRQGYGKKIRTASWALGAS